MIKRVLGAIVAVGVALSSVSAFAENSSIKPKPINLQPPIKPQPIKPIKPMPIKPQPPIKPAPIKP